MLALNLRQRVHMHRVSVCQHAQRSLRLTVRASSTAEPTSTAVKQVTLKAVPLTVEAFKPFGQVLIQTAWCCDWR